MGGLHAHDAEVRLVVVNDVRTCADEPISNNLHEIKTRFPERSFNHERAFTSQIWIRFSRLLSSVRRRKEDGVAISQRSQAIGEACRRKQRKLEGGFETDLGLCGAGLPRGKELTSLAVATEGGGIQRGERCGR